MRHSSDSALSAWSGGVCDSPASRTIVHRVEANKPSREVSVANVAGMRRFYPVGEKLASQIRERCADFTSRRRNRLTHPCGLEKLKGIQTMPSFIRPASLIMFWFHGGSQTS